MPTTSSIVVALLAWALALLIFLGFIILLRYIDHRERMALINKGIEPMRFRSGRKGTGILRAGLIVFMIGLALTVGLYPIGFMIPANVFQIPYELGPWLLPGLIPLGVGMALIISYYLAPPNDVVPPAPPMDMLPEQEVEEPQPLD